MNRLRFGLAAGAAAYLPYRALTPRYDFRPKHVVITRGTRGLGLVVARQVAARGAHLSICSRNAEQVRTAETELRSRTTAVFAAACDVTDRTQVRGFFADARRALGPV